MQGCLHGFSLQTTTFELYNDVPMICSDVFSWKNDGNFIASRNIVPLPICVSFVGESGLDICTT